MSVVTLHTDAATQKQAAAKVATQKTNAAKRKIPANACVAPLVATEASMRKPSVYYMRQIARQKAGAVATGVIAIIVTAISLSHLAYGLSLVTHSETWQAWAMAIGIDMGFIALEIAMIVARNETIRKDIGIYAHATIIGTLIISAGMNAYAFAGGQPNLSFTSAIAVLLGCAMPAGIYCLTRVTTLLWLDAHK